MDFSIIMDQTLKHACKQSRLQRGVSRPLACLIVHKARPAVAESTEDVHIEEREEQILELL